MVAKLGLGRKLLTTKGLLSLPSSFLEPLSQQLLICLLFTLQMFIVYTTLSMCQDVCNITIGLVAVRYYTRRKCGVHYQASTGTFS